MQYHAYYAAITCISWIHCINIYLCYEGWCGSLVGSMLDSHTDNPCSYPGKIVLFVRILPAFHLVWTYWEAKGVSISYRVYAVWDVKRTLVLEMEGFCLSHHHYHRPFLHSHKINELHRDVKQYSIDQFCYVSLRLHISTTISRNSSFNSITVSTTEQLLSNSATQQQLCNCSTIICDYSC